MSSNTLVVHRTARGLATALVETGLGSSRIVTASDGSGESLAEPVASLEYDRVLVTVPLHVAAFRILELPFSDRRRLAQAVPPTLEEHVPFSVEEATVAFDTCSTHDGRSRVLAAMCRREVLEEQRDAFSDLLVQPRHELWAAPLLLDAYRRTAADAGLVRFVAVDVGDDGAVVSRHDGERLVDLRVVAPGNDDELAARVAWALESYDGEDLPVVLGGAKASLADDALDGKTTVVRLSTASPLPGGEDLDWSRLATLAGLVRRATGETSRPILDFGDTAAGFAWFEQWRDELRPLALWAAAAALLALVGAGVDYARLSSRHAALDRRAEEVFQAAMPGAKGGPAKRLKLEMRLRELTGAIAVGDDAGASPLLVLAAMSDAVPKSLDVTLEEYSQDGARVRVSGKAASFETVTRLEEKLRESGVFSTTEVRDVHAATSGDGVEFQVLLGVGGGGGA